MKKNYIALVKNSILKPIDNVEAYTINDKKSIYIFSAIVTCSIMLLNLVSQLINSIFNKKFDFWTQKYSWDISLSNLQGLDYFDLILMNLLKYAIIIFGISLVYYLFGSVVNKKLSYDKILNVVCLAIIPNVVFAFVGSILGIFWEPFSIAFGTVGVLYTILILVTVFKSLFKITDINKLIVYNVITLSIIKLLDYIVFTVDIF